MMMRVIGVAGVLAAASAVVAETRIYEVEIVPTWSNATHPGAFPGNAHFSWFGGGVHSDAASFWSVGTPASPGVKQMAETGVTTILVETEVRAAVTAGTALSEINQTYWFCPPETSSGSCGPLTFEIEVSDAFPLVTLASMLGPSPDWFVGVSGLSLRDGEGWASELTIDLRPYDAGTRSNNHTFNLFGPLNSPPEPVSLITEKDAQIITGASLGSMIFRLVTPACAADFNSDGMIDSTDLASLLAFWEQAGETDLNGDGTTDSGDLAMVLAGWGACAG